MLDLSGKGVRAARLADRTVALTFDDGPDPRWTPRLLSLLEAKKVPATFFLVGSRVLDNPALVARERRDGDALGVHTFTHIDLGAHPPWQDTTEIALTQKALAAAAGVHSALLRPPYSSTPAAVTATDLHRWRVVAPGELVVLADRDSEDWQRPGVAQILANATPSGSHGAVVMFHDGGGDRSQTIAAVGRLIDRLRAGGWRLVTVPGGLGIAPAAAMPAADGSSRVQGWALLGAEGGALLLARVLGWLLIGVAVLSVARALLLVVFATVHARRHGGGSWPAPAAPAPAAARVPSVSVVVPSYNEQAGIAATVTSLAESDYPELEIVVVDDGSTDDTAGVVSGLQEQYEQLVLVQQGNAGKARALNAGIAAAHGEVLVLVDGDTVLEADTVTHLVAPLADPGVGAVAGNTKVGNRRGLLGRWQHIEYVVGFNLDRRLFDLASCMQTVPGAIGAFRRAALADVGGVPTDTLAEDTDLTLLLGLAGWRVAYAGHARAWTEAPATLGSLWRQPLPVGLRHDAGRLQAPPAAGRGPGHRPRRRLHSPGPARTALPARVRRRPAAAGPAGGSVRRGRSAVRLPGGCGSGLGDVRCSAVRPRRLRPAPGRRTAAHPVGTAAAASRLPPADVPRRRPVHPRRPDRHPAALAQTRPHRQCRRHPRTPADRRRQARAARRCTYRSYRSYRSYRASRPGDGAASPKSRAQTRHQRGQAFLAAPPCGPLTRLAAVAADGPVVTVIAAAVQPSGSSLCRVLASASASGWLVGSRVRRRRSMTVRRGSVREDTCELSPRVRVRDRRPATAAGVVESLEVVQVDHQHRQRPAVSGSRTISRSAS